jgi:hypothetical protein
MLAAGFSFLAFMLAYRRYYNYMKKAHKDKWFELMRRDPLVESAGAWIRWPVGSIHLIFSIFDTCETYGDKNVKQYKRCTVVLFCAFIIAFVSFFAICAAWPNYGP